MTKTDLQSDLLADLRIAADARPLPTDAVRPGPPPLPVSQGEQLRPPTPSLDVRVTPLRWNWPGLVSPDPALGLRLGVRVGPVQISLTLGS
ncbi:MAG: hypothetical protein QOE05_1793 [Actinomycetota bacterium]|jgi:hypothetical protein|nr:hypothetical protein [Actinomycetota bacterium]